MQSAKPDRKEWGKEFAMIKKKEIKQKQMKNGWMKKEFAIEMNYQKKYNNKLNKS